MVGLVVVAGLGWSGYWWAGAQAMEAGLDAWFDDRRGEGWVAEYQSLDTSGYPTRFDTVLTDLTLADPQTGWAWTAPTFALQAESTRPTAFTAIWPDAQKLQTPISEFEIISQEMTASLAVDAATSLPLAEGTATMGALAITSLDGWELRADRMALSMTRVADTDQTYDLVVEGDNIRPDDALRVGLRLDPPLPEAFETLRISATVAFDRPWDRRALEDRRPQPTQVALDLAQGTWGQLDLRATGRVDVDAEGVPTGEIAVKAKNWCAMVAVAVATGAIPENLGSTLESGLGLLAALSGNPDSLDLPLSFAGGRMAIGPIPLGPAPRIRLR